MTLYNFFVSVLNFVSIPVSRECLSGDGRRSGICLNPYECKIQQGVSNGQCALGFGVCCVFSETCGSKAFNNITYFVSPHFPGLSPQSRSCPFTIKKISPQISQIRLDFVHFNLAQPNRKTGICETDVMAINSEMTPEFRLCGINNGQHIYYDVEDVRGDINIVMNLTREGIGRLWEIKITQIEYRNKAPTGCMQYFRQPSGVIQTMNFADNGRHLANQDYTICMRQELGMCSIVYEPCDENSFRIGPASMMMSMNDEGSGSEPDAPEAREDECSDRIVMPCDSEEFIMPNDNIPGVCDLLHCGSSFCNMGENPCRIESSTIPFNIRVQFGPALREESPDDNLGMCLKFEQQPCS
ncbi:UNVERIFIED_CONTAM: hypothetical protein PYX00_002768 [Menopon gallinae]|uniref:CUB domain-containing protein n=1 Tax=Menopon gallinae TaxID=328185 RepID=A0AAW2HXL3_9NEOP